MSKVWRLPSKVVQRRSDAERKWTAVPPQTANTSRTLQSPKVHGAGNTESGRFLSFLSKVRSPQISVSRYLPPRFQHSLKSLFDPMFVRNQFTGILCLFD